jgi:hypothetical protein
MHVVPAGSDTTNICVNHRRGRPARAGRRGGPPSEHGQEHGSLDLRNVDCAGIVILNHNRLTDHTRFDSRPHRDRLERRCGPIFFVTVTYLAYAAGHPRTPIPAPGDRKMVCTTHGGVRRRAGLTGRTPVAQRNCRTSPTRRGAHAVTSGRIPLFDRVFNASRCHTKSSL